MTRRLHERIAAWRQLPPLAPRRFVIYAALAFIPLLVIAFQMKPGWPVINWMNVFRVEDTSSVGAFEFIRSLRVPIPPNLALVEIADYRVTGTTALATGFLYRAYVALSYGCALGLAYPSRVRLACTGVLGLLFAYATKAIHPGNPQIYDVAAPCFFMLFAVCLRFGAASQRPRVATSLLVSAGFFLSMFELSRAYVVYLVPFVLLFTWGVLRSRRFLLVVVPVIAISGTWHAHLLISFRQTTASNHFGVNLWRCWHSKVGPLARPVREDDAPLAEGRWANLNNPQHLKNSLRLRKKVKRYILDHPVDSAGFMLERMLVITSAPTAIYTHRPTGALLSIYSETVRGTSALLACAFFFVIGRSITLLLRRRRGAGTLFAEIDWIVAFIALASLFIMAIGEVEEEARFVISTLPMLATVPFLDRWLPGTGQRAIGK